ncbi:MAG: TonB-dependent receptor [Calditrichaeota bacterium]|nr:MAG: TonB-dependent receptor [Calditrichota bacterium]
MKFYKNLRVFFIVSTVLCCSFSTEIIAQTTGKIKGRITEERTGEALAGASVVIDGTNRGAAADLNGEYVILNMPPGKYSLTFRMMGYGTKKIADLTVSVNRTVTVDVQMQDEVLSGEEIIITASKMGIKKDQTSSIRNVSAESIEILPVSDVAAVVEMQAGVVKGHFRGGRVTEVSYMIDGLQVDEVFDGQYRTVDLEPESIQDLEVITGTFNAEYGRAMSGIVNAVTKDGGSEFHGSFSSEWGGYLTGNNDIWYGLDEVDFLRNQDYKASLSGPLFTNKLTFFTNIRSQDNKNHLYGIRRFDVDNFSNFRGDDPSLWFSQATGDSAYVPMDRDENFSVMGKLTAHITDALRVSFLSTYNKDTWRDYDHGFKYNPDGKPASHRDSKMNTLQVNHLLSERMFYELKLSRIDNFSGWYVFEDPFDTGYVHDLFHDDTGPGFWTGGQNKDHNERTLIDTNLKWDFTWQINKKHSIKTGLLYTEHDLDVENVQIRNKYYGTDLEFFLYEPVTLPDSTVYSDIYHVKPVEFAAYVQDKMEFSEMVVNLGLRYDYFDPASVYPSERRNPANQLSYPEHPERQSTYPDAKPQVQLSPRLGLSYQLGEAALLRFSYGHFFQMPPLFALYENSSFRVAPTNYETTMGNAQLKAQKTVQYEVGLWQQLMDNMGLEVALFYRDIYDLLGAKVVTTFNQIRYGLYDNKDYGSVKGLELKYDYNQGPVSAVLNYTLQFTRGNADNPTQTFDRAGDSKDPIPRLIPMSWDQRHTFNFTVGYNQPNYGLTSILSYGSGSPYSYSPLTESILSRVNLYENNDWMPSVFDVDINAYYKWNLSHGVGLRFTLQVYNFLDRLNENWVNGNTGRAYRSIITDADIAGHRSDFNTFEDTIQNPSAYSAPRLIKFGVGVTF